MTPFADLSPLALVRSSLRSRSDLALSALESRTAHSWMMRLHRAKALPDTSSDGAVRLFVQSGAGGRVTDVDGTSFIDLCLGEGTQILGHAHPDVQQAIVAQSTRGWHFDLPADGQLRLARLIQAVGPANERVALCASGDEALEFAGTLARSFSGKSAIAVFTGYRTTRRAGDLAVSVLPYGHLAALDQVRRRHHNLAAVIVEPVRGSDPGLGHGAWLHELSETCRAAGVLLILDERQTGFRLAYGGAQEVFGLIPDLTVYGHAVGGGLPLGAVAGRADVMATRESASLVKSAARDSAAAASPLSIEAGAAALACLHAGRTTLYPALNERGRALTERFNSFAASERLPVEMRSAGSMFRISFGGITQACETGTAFRAAESAFNVLMLSRGVLMQTCRKGFLATAHTAADIDYVLAAMTESLRDIRDDGHLADAS